MRLVDADKIDFSEVFVGQSDFAKDTRKAAHDLVDRQPTAYDVDAVIEEIKDCGAETCASVSCNGECSECDHGALMKTLVEIVRNGGKKE